MAWIQTHEDPRFRQLTGGDIFTFNSGKPEEDFLQGWWLRIEGPIDQKYNAVRLSDGGKHAFKKDDKIEYCYMRLST